jgi:fused signal recognition particle receptor
MSEGEQPKRGFFSRLFGIGKGKDEAKAPAAVRQVLAAPPAPEPVAEQQAIAEVVERPVVPEPSEVVLAEVVPQPEEQPEEATSATSRMVPPPESPAVPEKQAPLPEPEPAPLPPAPLPAPVASPVPPVRKSFWRRLSEGLSRTSSSLTTGITDLFTKRKLDAATLEDLEDILIQADLGLESSSRIARAVGQSRYEKGVSPEAVREILAREVAAILEPVAKPLQIQGNSRPITILMVGVNGSGKTTTIGKMAAKFRAEGQKVVLAAGDTFRAAAIEQLKVWGERTGATVIARAQGSDAASLAFDALTEARASGADILLIDTAGRLQNKTGLMDELAKVVRVIKKIDESAPHAVLLVLDATVGQNAISQVEAFRQIAGVTGLVMTKLDGTARGGILVALSARFGLPVHLIGVGEGVDDLETFDAQQFARAIVGLEEHT